MKYLYTLILLTGMFSVSAAGLGSWMDFGKKPAPQPAPQPPVQKPQPKSPTGK
jgi:hypothetical protein